MTHSQPKQIRIDYYPGVPADVVEELAGDFLKIAPSVSRTETSPGPQGAIFLALPAVIAVFIGLSVAGGFTNKLGEDLYDVVKRTSLKALRAMRDFPARWQSGGDVGSPPPLSYKVQIEENQAVKFIFPPGLGEDAIIEAVESLPAAIARAADAEEEFRKDQGGGFLGSRTVNYVYLEENGEWAEMTALVLMNYRPKRRDG